MSGQPPIVDPYEYIQIVRNPDGTITRNPNQFQLVPATSEPSHPGPAVLSKDIPVNGSKSTWIRLYLPGEALDSSSSGNKMPLIVYYHGGGFVVGSVDLSLFHDFCANMARDLGVMVASAAYRLCPEHRLPAAYDDGVEALHWIKSSPDSWLKGHADLSKCFIMGTSAGGNLAYHAGLRAAEAIDDLQPLKIRGLILHHPFFGGVERSGSETRLVNDAVLPPIVSDVFWDLSLPAGADRDHEYCNPTAGGGSKLLEKLRGLGWRVMVMGCDGDPLLDRQVELAELIRAKDVSVVGHFSRGDYHGVEILEPSRATRLYAVIKDFVSSTEVQRMYPM